MTTGSTRSATWAHESLQRRLLLAVSLPFLAVVVLTAGTFLVREHALDTREASTRSLETALALERLVTATLAAGRAAGDYATTGQAQHLREYDAALADRADLQELLARQLDDGTRERGRPAELVEAVAGHDATLRSLVSQPVTAPERRRLQATAAADEERIRDLATTVIREQEGLHLTTRTEADRLNAWITASGVVIGAVGLVGGVLAVLFLSRRVVRRLRRVQENAGRLGTGEQLLPDLDGHDEIAALARTVEGAHTMIRDKETQLDLALEVGGMLIFELRPDETITLRGEPALLRTIEAEGPVVTTTLDALRRWLLPGEDDSVTRLPSGDITVRTVTGETRQLEVRSRERAAADGAPSGTVVGVVADVTARAGVQAALERAKEEAERASRSKDEFLSRMSHELRTPLNAVLGFAQLLSMEELDDEQRESVDHILKGGRHLLALVNDVLDLARVESGRLSLSVEPTRLRDVVEEALQMTRPLARDQRVRLEVRGDVDVHALVDRRRMKQVLINLVSNAIKYNRPDGTVTVDWRITEQGLVRVAVTDTGIGISERQRADLFVPFARSDERAADIEGSGLGLAVSRSLVEAMGGELTLTHTSELGSTIVVDVPEAGDVAIALAAHHDSSRALEVLRERGPLSVLHIEDNAANRRLVEALLQRAGCPPPVSAGNGETGLHLAREHRPDLILLDRHLPDLLGEEVLRQLKSDDRTAGIPVVVVSADAMDRSAGLLLREGAAAFVAKPIDAEEFWLTVSSVMTERGGSR